VDVVDIPGADVAVVPGADVIDDDALEIPGAAYAAPDVNPQGNLNPEADEVDVVVDDDDGDAVAPTVDDAPNNDIGAMMDKQYGPLSSEYEAQTL
jgi:hypothetical protein